MDDRSAQYIIITDEPWPRVFPARARDFNQALKDGTLPYKVKRRFGPYIEGGLIKVALKILRRLFPFKDKKSLDERHDAFYRAIGHSPHDTDEDARKRYRRTINYLILFFEGKKDILRRRLVAQMNTAVKELKFEEAGQIKYLLHALDHINDIALIKRDLAESGRFSIARQYRMEAYDVAHLGGMETVGAMVVSENGQLAPAAAKRDPGQARRECAQSPSHHYSSCGCDQERQARGRQARGQSRHYREISRRDHCLECRSA